MKKFFEGSLVVHKHTNTFFKVLNSTIGLYELQGKEIDDYCFVNLISMVKDFRLASKTEILLYGEEN